MKTCYFKNKYFFKFRKVNVKKYLLIYKICSHLYLPSPVIKTETDNKMTIPIEYLFL